MRPRVLLSFCLFLRRMTGLHVLYIVKFCRPFLPSEMPLLVINMPRWRPNAGHGWQRKLYLDRLADSQGLWPVGLPGGHAPGDGQALRGVPQQPRKVLARAHRRRRRRERTLR